MSVYRIHGDNIVECERIAKLILRNVEIIEISKCLISPSTVKINAIVNFNGLDCNWELILLPGFNKSGRNRWEHNIFTVLKNNGSFLDETPDAILTKVENDNEVILCAIEFCSALQAGNQAWQRSGRAFSAARANCPYIYIVDFVKYELDSSTRERKTLRFPNPAIPYSYIKFGNDIDTFVTQVYSQSEEFDNVNEEKLIGFDVDKFGVNDLSNYLVKKMLGEDTCNEENNMLQKNMYVVDFISKSLNFNTNLSNEQWKCVFENNSDLVEFSKNEITFPFHKKITNRGVYGHVVQLNNAIESLSVGLIKKDLPFGIIPKENRRQFANAIKSFYPNFEDEILNKIGDVEKNDLIVCMFKGFKPQGDDNRPDRGLLPLIHMLTDSSYEIFTFIYGPVIYNNYVLLQENKNRLGQINGLWNSIISLSDYICLDVPLLRATENSAELLIDNQAFKNDKISIPQQTELISPIFSAAPSSYHEDDVDTAMHFLFSHILSRFCFEGLCNPPGGDWSGLSVLLNDTEYRWLTLPRVSDAIGGKRPDHVFELFGLQDKPILLSVESKENSSDLEDNVGNGLKNYISHLMNFIPSCERLYNHGDGEWEKSSNVISFSEFDILSVAAYLKCSRQANDTVFANSNCDMLFIMDPKDFGWDVEIVTKTEQAETVKNFIVNNINSNNFYIH